MFSVIIILAILSILRAYLVLFLLDVPVALSLNCFIGFSLHPPPLHLLDFFHLLSSAVPRFPFLLLLYKSCAPNLGQVDSSHLSVYHAVHESLCGSPYKCVCLTSKSSSVQLIHYCCLAFSVLAALVLIFCPHF